MLISSFRMTESWLDRVHEGSRLLRGVEEDSAWETTAASHEARRGIGGRD